MAQSAQVQIPTVLPSAAPSFEAEYAACLTQEAKNKLFFETLLRLQATKKAARPKKEAAAGGLPNSTSAYFVHLCLTDEQFVASKDIFAENMVSFARQHSDKKTANAQAANETAWKKCVTEADKKKFHADRLWKFYVEFAKLDEAHCLPALKQLVPYAKAVTEDVKTRYNAAKNAAKVAQNQAAPNLVVPTLGGLTTPSFPTAFTVPSVAGLPTI
jgi:hypothetical protein